MLEIRDLVKIYKGKGGAEVRALDGVSAKFGATGMVFVLGKSGSGKSTLLNVCGGLDTPDGGEIIIDGKSSKDFTGSDSDSYRNTFVGFIFQEYNLLNDFTVEENIALALELQGRGKEKQKVYDILARVDMTEFAARKPNTLSGGQKQRVAIARALVKDPEIIMADEPTGALDSETGEQVLKTLKKLSQEKLVIVVSHDRDFAARYADRIIELSDGKIISDRTRAGGELSDDGAIAIGEGGQLTQADIEKINALLRSSDEDLVISRGERRSPPAFEPTSEKDDGAADRPRKALIPSRLPFRHAIKMGAGGLRVKPLRLFFTVLLSFISLTFFGIYSTFTFFDEAEATFASYQNSDMQSINLKKFYNTTNIIYYNGTEDERTVTRHSTNFTVSDLGKMRARYGATALGALNLSQYDTPLQVRNINRYDDIYYSPQIAAFALFDAVGWQDRLLTATDLKNLADDEIVISSYTFDSLREAGFKDEDGHIIALENYSDIVGKTLFVNAYANANVIALKVAGVYSNDMPEKFDELKTVKNSFERYDLYEDMLDERNYGSYRTVLVGDGFYEANAKYFGAPATINKDYGFTRLGKRLISRGYTVGGSEYSTYYFDDVNTLPVKNGAEPEGLTFFDGRQTKTLGEGEVAVPAELLSWQTEMLLSDYISSLNDRIHGAADDEVAAIKEQIEQTRTEVTDALYTLTHGNKQTQITLPDGTTQTMTVTADLNDLTAAAEELAAFYNKTTEGYIGMDIRFEDEQSAGDFRAVALYYGGVTAVGRGMYFCQRDFERLIQLSTDGGLWTYETVTKFRPEQNAIISFITVPRPQTISMLRDLVFAEYEADDKDCSFYPDSAIRGKMLVVTSVTEILSPILLWIGVATALFAIMLLFNFISVSITYKKKEIGILRALGARSADVFKIFCSESLIIAAICYILAVIGCFAICAAINAELAGAFGIALLVFGPASWFIMLAIAVLTSVIATFLPVYGIAKRKPADSIRAL